MMGRGVVEGGGGVSVEIYPAHTLGSRFCPSGQAIGTQIGGYGILQIP